MRSLSPLYDTSRELMQTGDVFLWRSKSVIGWLSRLFSQGQYNHAGLVIRPDDRGPFSGRRFTIEALEGGIVLCLLSERIRRYRGKVVLFRLKDEYDPLRPQILEWAIEQEGAPYDYPSLFRQIIGRVSLNAKEWFCSEFVQTAFLQAGIPIFDDKVLRPGDIPLLPIFEGPITIFER